MRVQRKMTILVSLDRMATVTQVTTLYIRGKQKSSSESAAWQTLRQMFYISVFNSVSEECVLVA